VLSARSGRLLRAVAIPVLCIGFGIGLEGTARSAGDAEPKGSPAFRAAWKGYQEGEPSPQLAFQAIADDTSATELDRFNSRYILAVIALAHGAHDVALEQLAAADALVPGRPQVSLRRAQVLIAKKDHAGAALELKKAKGIQKGSPLFAVQQIALARVESANGQLEKGIARLEEVCKLEKRSWECHFALATLYESQDQPQKAIASYATVIDLDPKRDPTGAIYAYQRWAALSIASDPNSYSNKALMAKAKERYTTFLDRAPKNAVPEALVEATRQMLGVFEYFK